MPTETTEKVAKSTVAWVAMGKTAVEEYINEGAHHGT